MNKITKTDCGCYNGYNKGAEEVLISGERIHECVKRLGEIITRDYYGKNLVVIGVLKGSFIFIADLIRHIRLPLELDFITLSSYGKGTVSAEDITVKGNFESEITGKDVLIAEDILDTGRTLAWLTEHIKSLNPASVKICAFLDKPERRIGNVNADYVGFTIPNEFVVGYGLDVAEKYRNLPYIAKVEELGVRNQE